VLQLHEGLTKRQSAILVQLRTEKLGLRDFLFRRKVPDIQSNYAIGIDDEVITDYTMRRSVRVSNPRT
jgi:hypothetical protein